MTLKFAKPSVLVKELEENLRELSLAYKTEVDDTLDHPLLIDGDLTLEGGQAIKNHLDQLSGELKKWWYCDC